MSDENPVCRTCGHHLVLDLNGNYFCLNAVIMEEEHDDHYPSPFIQVKREDLEQIFNVFDFEGFWDEMEDASYQSLQKIMEEYGIE